MGYRPEPKLGATPIVFLLIVLSVGFGIGYFEDTKPHNEYVQNKTRSILSQAHKEAVNSVDTLDLRAFNVNAESACQDSARLAKEMHEWMKHQGENPKFCNYKEVYDTIHMKNGETGFRLSKYPWRIDIAKAKRDKYFATNYDAYKNAVRKLEIARRQQKQK